MSDEMLGPIARMHQAMEPEAAAALSPEHAALVSIAISLKRIADAVTGDGVSNLHGPLTNLAWEVGNTLGRAFEIGSRR